MGTYFSKSDKVSEISESVEIVDETCSKDMIATSRFVNNHALMSVSRKYEYWNNREPTDEKIAKEVEEKYAFTNKSYILPNCKVRIEFLKHPASTELNNNSNEKPHIQSDDYLNKVVDVTKLIAQLMSSKVVLTKLKEPSTLKFPATQAISVHKNIDLDDDDDDEEEEEEDVASETVSDEYAHRYCAKCKKLKFARIKDPAWKNCSNCKIAMTYLCVKCNVKYYKRYPFLKLHLERCDGNGDGLAKPTVDQDIDTGSNADKDIDTRSNADKDIDTESNAANEKKSTLILDKNQFIVKQNQEVNTTEKFYRYCPQCKVSAAYYNERPYKCKTCDGSKKLIYVCTKCKKNYNVLPSLQYHVESQCYWTHQYQCTECEYSGTCWRTMQKHFRNQHTDQPKLKCEFCPHETNSRSNLNGHTKNVHRNLLSDRKLHKQFHCSICSYKTDFYKNLRRHRQSEH